MAILADYHAVGAPIMSLASRRRLVGSRMNVIVDNRLNDEKRLAIMSIAFELFLETGYVGTSMSAIAARTGGSKGTLYNYFRSKADLFTAIVDHQCSVSQAEILEFSGPNLEANVKLMGGRLARLMLSDEVIRLHRIIAAEVIRFPEIGQALYEAGPQRVKSRLVGYFGEAIAHGHLRACDPGLAAEQVIELVLAGLYRRRLWNIGPPPTEAEIDANVTAAAGTFMAAFGPV